jgi:hypothetical protein
VRVSFGHEDEFRLWMVYHLQDDEDAGVVVGMYPDDDAEQIGAVPDWLDYERENTGWQYLVMADFDNLLEWGLENGISPGQPFLVRFGRPTYQTYSGPDGTDYDVDYDNEVVAVEPLPFAEWSARMQRALEDDLEEREASAFHSVRREHERRFNRDSMHLRFSTYFAPRDPYWDDMCYPSGVRVNLCSSALDKSGVWPIASGQDDGGDHGKALDRLVADAGIKLPHLSPRFIRGLRRFS